MYTSMFGKLRHRTGRLIIRRRTFAIVSGYISTTRQRSIEYNIKHRQRQPHKRIPFLRINMTSHMTSPTSDRNRLVCEPRRRVKQR
jgi:hypothetical protein